MYLAVLCAILLLSLGTTGQTPKTKPKVVSQGAITGNSPATELYLNKLTLKVTLINLPGASHMDSSWQAEYQVYFVAEQEFEASMKRLTRNDRGREPTPSDFPGKILLTEGRFEKKGLSRLEERTFVSDGIEFKRKIPIELQTSFSSILVFYSIKIYDDKLRKNIYKSGVAIYPPFDTDSKENGRTSPRRGVYLSFYVAENGAVYWSSRKSAGETTEWMPR